MYRINRIYDPKIQPVLNDMHAYLMGKGFPYSSVSVVYHPYMGGLCCYFSNLVRERVTQEVISFMKACGFGYVINAPS